MLSVAHRNRICSSKEEISSLNNNCGIAKVLQIIRKENEQRKALVMCKIVNVEMHFVLLLKVGHCCFLSTGGRL